MNWKIWILVPILYGIFSLWYFNWRGPITAAEIEHFMEAFSEAEGSRYTDAAVIRHFLETDDGSEFVMLNLVQLHRDEVAHPVSGVKMTPQNLLSEYFGPFALSLLKRGGHPVFQARTVGGQIDAWQADDNVDFGGTAMMRYKSRRDLVELVIDPAFADAHIFKLAAIERTISYPTQMRMSTALHPPVTMLLVLLLFASIAQNVAFFVKRE